jgi:hypothetical protein
MTPTPHPYGSHKPAVNAETLGPKHSAMNRAAQAPSPVDAGVSGLGPITPTPGAATKSPRLPRGRYGILRHLNLDTEDDADPNSQHSAAHLRPDLPTTPNATPTPAKADTRAMLSPRDSPTDAMASCAAYTVSPMTTPTPPSYLR